MHAEQIYLGDFGKAGIPSARLLRGRGGGITLPLTSRPNQPIRARLDLAQGGVASMFWSRVYLHAKMVCGCVLGLGGGGLGRWGVGRIGEKYGEVERGARR